MEKIVAVRLRDTGQNFPYNAGELEVKEGTMVIVEHDRGLDYGQVMSLKADSHHEAEKQPVKKIIRIAKDNDLKQIEDNRAKSKEAFTTCAKKIEEHKLDMKMVQAEYSFDRSKIIFYFTAEGRVDFRELVKDLAKIFKARIELRQIGVRDETRFFGGYGPCGRELCCAKFLKDFEPVTIKMAKEEGLPLNPPKISGICGRLMCCLNYEYETYKMLSRGLPREGERITTADGKGKVISVNVFKRRVTVEMEEGKIVELSYKDQEKEPEKTGEQQKAPERERPAERERERDSGRDRPRDNNRNRDRGQDNRSGDRNRDRGRDNRPGERNRDNNRDRNRDRDRNRGHNQDRGKNEHGR